MKLKILIPFLAILFLLPISSCKKVNTTEEVPNCIKRKIRKNSKTSLGSVIKYDYKSGEIYQFNHSDIIGSSYIYDTDCNELCSDRDVEGNTLCEEILDLASNDVVIWVKE